SEADKGMYDALNKGIERVLNSVNSDLLKGVSKDIPNNHSPITNNSRDSVMAWLNCDEQYLPDTLAFARDWFFAHPKADLLSGSALLTRPDGSLLAYRKAVPLRWQYVAASHLYNLSCGMFFRRAVWDRGVRFDVSYKNIGDQDWIMRLLQDGIKAGYTDRFFSAFCFTGQNLSQNESAVSEAQRLRTQHPLVQQMRFPLNLMRWAEKVIHGAYHQKPFDYAVYTGGEPVKRERFHVQNASFRWPEKQEGLNE
ncbi:MAG: hypothetical protein MUC65_09355, partial [Pontiellaceae bacterium]|nr:hypothetical protein [Pontiellaceae bacterium]